MPKSFLLYGAYGYTGRLIAEEAAKRGVRPILSGRDEEKTRLLALSLGFDHRPFRLDDQKAMDAVLQDVDVVLHAAGPFVHTARPMAEACLRTQTDYLDITGEIDVIEMLASPEFDEAGRQQNVMFMPGTGFDVVPSDCLALYLKEQLPTATHLTIAFLGLRSGVSRGTAKSGVEHFPQGGWLRQNGELIPIPSGGKPKWIDYGRGPKKSVLIPWGDIGTAWRSTHIPNIEVYSGSHAPLYPLMVMSRYLKGLFAARWFKNMLTRAVDRFLPPGPTPEQRADGRTIFYGEVTDNEGNHHAARLTTPEGYRLTALTALEIAHRTLKGDRLPGFATPAQVYGSDFIMQFENVKRVDAAV